MRSFYYVIRLEILKYSNVPLFFLINDVIFQVNDMVIINIRVVNGFTIHFILVSLFSRK